MIGIAMSDAMTRYHAGIEGEPVIVTRTWAMNGAVEPMSAEPKL